ncbi:MAG: 4-hydroxyacetophenone monooxygenase [Segetibacter sp.]|nr:4-hydroxyacetophenone monooxygenase [Segetibacter sp.]
MNPDYQVGIVGAGFAGLAAALQLKNAGKNSFVIFERAPEIGGTWRDNIYPGCACDVASPLYSFSSAPNPTWNNLYSSQPEIFSYLKNVVNTTNLEKHIKLNTDIVEARFLKENGWWVVTDKKGNRTTVSILLLALGPLNRPNIPAFPRLEEFKGKCFHTGEWDNSYDLAGKNVAVIGTGASAIQVIPNIASLVRHLVVLQRTPPWITYRFDKKISNFSKTINRRFPIAQRFKRETIYWVNELFGLGFIGNKTVNTVMKWLALIKLKREVKDVATREKLRPGYQIGCKRILKSDDYYQTFNRSNVSLVTEPIDRFTEQGILTADGKEHGVDIAIFATGFIAADLHLYINVIGAAGRNLIEDWKVTGAEAYLGTTVAGYPNLALLLGPNTGLGHNSILHMVESQMNYLGQYIDFVEKSGNVYLDIKPEVQKAYNDKLQNELKGTVWASGCKSWYMNANGKNTTLYPKLTVTFRKQTKRFSSQVYNVVEF